MRPSLHFGMCGDDLAATVRFLQDVQIRELVCDVRQIPGRQEKGLLTREDLRVFAFPFADAGIGLAVVTVGWIGRDADGHQCESQLATICQDIAVLGEAGVPVAQVFETGVIPRGADSESYRDCIYRSYRRMVGACADAGMRLAIHGGWQTGHALWNTASYLALFDAVPDAHNGVCLCAGSYYQAGDSVLEAICRLAGRIHFVHFRDAAEIGGDCPEMLLGNGRVPFAAVAEALREVGYDGPVHCEHFGRFRSEPHGEIAAAWGAGFMRGLLQTR